MKPGATTMTNDYEAKQQARRDRLEAAAARARDESVQHQERGIAAVRHIPFGQPILVGHHSERKHRRALEKARSEATRAVEAHKRAEELERRAASVGKAGISSDDPEAVAKLRERVAKLEADQQQMKAANACIRRKDDAGLAALGFNEAQIAKLKQPDFCGRIGFPNYALTNNSANIRRLKQRLAQLQRTATVAEAVKETTGETERETLIGKVRIVENFAANRLQLFFPGKPSFEVRSELKLRGFRWAPSEMAWQRHLSNQALFHATEIAKKYA